ncbi:hypothetical protein PR202_gb11155 [Eleusine coracana subsp. coracana]|uniref:Uncharacterized protein n=1 Tax=Eleusine coracana subsp. coracana TaxID=191504 RepID=A0AAV5EJH6_ELECO|nr:hypothetical protein PR202_gb11155 [Eleusine coracana subsp. coracana]
MPLFIGATGCLVVDFEPVKPTEFPATAAGALQSYKLAAKAISKIQSLPGGSMEALCNTVVKEVFDLTGYDRVMAYRFHEDEHGEVFAEITKPGIEPYLGLHYPATDIPQAARNEEDDEAEPEQPSQQQKKKKLWGLIVCHHESPRYVPFPLRYVTLPSWLSEVHRDSTGLSTDSLHDAGYPGAASLGDMICGMAVAKITSKDILFWFRSHTAAEVKWGGAKHDPSEKDDSRRMHPRLSFKAFLEVVKMKSLPWSDYEMDAIHSMQLILRGTLSDANKPTKEPGLDNQIGDLKIDGLAELQAVTSEMVRLMETATVPILAVDGNGLINGREEKEIRFELKTHGSKRDDGPVILVVNACASRDLHDHVVGVCFVAQDMTVHKLVMDKFTRVEGDYKAIVHNPNPLIPPIFGADQFGWCSEWNAAMTKLTGWHRDEVIDKMLLGEVFDSNNASCRLKDKDAFVRLCIIINSALAGDEAEKTPFGFFDRNGNDELQHALHVQQASEQTALRKLKAFSYMRHAINKPLSGIVYCREALKSTGLNEEQMRQSITDSLPRKRDQGLMQPAREVYEAKGLWGWIKHNGSGVPADILSQMYDEDNKEQSEEGLSLLVSRNLLKLMNGDVLHLREAGMSTFILTAELASAPASSGH